MQDPDGHRGVAVQDLQKQLFRAIHLELCSKAKRLGRGHLSRGGDGVTNLNTSFRYQSSSPSMASGLM